jgi:hypothetical protein
MDTVTDRLDGRALSETDRVGQIGLFASSLGVDSSGLSVMVTSSTFSFPFSSFSLSPFFLSVSLFFPDIRPFPHLVSSLIPRSTDPIRFDTNPSRPVKPVRRQSPLSRDAHTHFTNPSSFQIASSNQSIPKSISQLIITVLPSPSLAIASSVSIETLSILL